MRKRLLSLGLVCTMLFAALAGCGSEPAAQDTGGGADKPAQSDTAKPAEPASTAKRVAVCLPLRDQFITTCETLTKKALEGKGYEVTVFDANGDISAEAVLSAVRPDTALVSVMMVNNELGNIYPIAEIARGLKAVNEKTLLHTDAVQGFLKVPFSANRPRN